MCELKYIGIIYIANAGRHVRIKDNTFIDSNNIL